MTAPLPLPGFAWDLDGFAFGRGTDINVSTVDLGSPEILQSDAAPPGGDGTRFGRDHRSGRLITFNLNVLASDASVLEQLDDLEARWLADDVRSVPGAMSVLRYQWGTRARRVYGRPRRFAANSALIWAGNIPVVCDFQCVDHLFYGDTLRVESVGVIPPSSSGGFDEPMDEPWTYTSVTESLPGSILVVGTKPVSPVFTVHGPIINPVIRISVIGDIRINTELANSFQSLQVDTRHWEMTVLDSDGVSLAGKLDHSAPPLDRVLLSPGDHTISLRGEDITGTARMEAAWRETFAGL